MNQCVGSGDGITTGCDPFPATTTGATITQCNGSANGGTLVELTCTATGTRSPAAPVRINQCNGSANGGGAAGHLLRQRLQQRHPGRACPDAGPGGGGGTDGSADGCRRSGTPLRRTAPVLLAVRWAAAGDLRCRSPLYRVAS